MDDIEKYSKKEEPKKTKEDELAEKAGICAEIVKRRNPGCSEQEVVREAAKLMHHRLIDLLEMRENTQPLSGLMSRYDIYERS